MLTCLIYFTLTVILPLRFTYHVLKDQSDALQLRLWANYWCYYSILLLIKQFLPFLTYQPFQLILLLAHLWLYLDEFKGALLLTQIIHNKLRQFHLDQKINLIKDKLKVLKVFEIEERSSPVVSSPRNRNQTPASQIQTSPKVSPRSKKRQ